MFWGEAVPGDSAESEACFVVMVTGTAFKGTLASFLSYALCQEEGGKKQADEKSPTKRLGLRHHPQRKKLPETENKEIEYTVLWSLEVQRAQILLIPGKGSLPCYISGNNDTRNWRPRGSIHL